MVSRKKLIIYGQYILNVKPFLGYSVAMLCHFSLFIKRKTYELFHRFYEFLVLSGWLQDTVAIQQW